jgi:hypothetical protein
MIAEKCVIIAGIGPNFNIEEDYDFLTILANSTYYRYNGEGAPKGKDSTTASLIGLKSPKYLSISFLR